jgi:hypothetical protein
MACVMLVANSMKYGTFNTLILLFLLAIRAHAVQMEPLSIDDLTARSEVVIIGSVETLTTLRDDEGRIVTRVLVKVEEVWKGPVTTNHFTILLAGGVLGDEKTVVTGQAEYHPGEEIVAFLALNKMGQGVTLGLIQGKFNIHTDTTSGRQTVQSKFHGKPPGGGPARGVGLQSLSTGTDELTLDSLKFKVSSSKASK